MEVDPGLGCLWISESLPLRGNEDTKARFKVTGFVKGR